MSHFKLDTKYVLYSVSDTSRHIQKTKYMDSYYSHSFETVAARFLPEHLPLDLKVHSLQTPLNPQKSRIAHLVYILHLIDVFRS